MLHRCRTTCVIVTLLILGQPSAWANKKMDEFRKQGERLAKASNPSHIRQQEIESITPKNDRGQSFDGESVKSQLLHNPYQTVNAKENDLRPDIQAPIENSEKLIDFSTSLHTAATPEETIEKCLYESTVIPVELHHTLSVHLKYTPEIKKSVKTCCWHTDTTKSIYPQEDKKRIELKLYKDPTIKEYEVHIEKKSIGHRDVVVSSWLHHDNIQSCDCFCYKDKVVTAEKWEEEDIWQFDRPELLDSIQCSVTSIETSLPETRLIEGREIFRSFWSKIHHLRCLQKKQKDCDFLKNKKCTLIMENCLKYDGNNCVELEQTFKCISPSKPSSYNSDEIYGLNTSLWKNAYQPNQQFSDAATKLAVFDGLKKELINSNAQDARSVSLFSAAEQKCSVSISENLLYDCCFDMDGLATQVKLSKCTSDEIALLNARSKGLCHYIGKKNEEFIGLWTSRKEHIFCTFSNKISRVFQEEARKQLGITWGTAEKPECRGLTQDEIKSLDFSKLDLREAFELPNEVDNTQKIKQIEDRLKSRLKEMTCT